MEEDGLQFSDDERAGRHLALASRQTGSLMQDMFCASICFNEFSFSFCITSCLSARFFFFSCRRPCNTTKHMLHPFRPIPTCKWKPISQPVTLFTDTTHTKYYSLCSIRILCPVSLCTLCCLLVPPLFFLHSSCSLLFAHICFHVSWNRRFTTHIDSSFEFLL